MPWTAEKQVGQWAGRAQPQRSAISASAFLKLQLVPCDQYAIKHPVGASR